MRVLALTHAHLHKEGLSPVSCERADSITGNWVEQLGWVVDVVYTKDTKWRGIWPEGKGLRLNIIEVNAPDGLMMGTPELFSVTARKSISSGKFSKLGRLVTARVTKRIRHVMAAEGFTFPHELAVAKKWGKLLASNTGISKNKYDFIFACVGYGDEYLLQTAQILSHKLHIPMVVDFRDLWSDHHDEYRLTEKQRRIIRKQELLLLTDTILISVPQQPMADALLKYLDIPVCITSHGAHIDRAWGDGAPVSDEFRLLYSGKIYAGNPGLTMLLQLLQKMNGVETGKPLKCHFFVDDTATLRRMAADMGISNSVVIHNWVTPEEIWKQMRSAHVLLIFDGGFYNNMPLIMTKTFQYAQTGRQILVLSKNGNSTYETLFDAYNAGSVFTNLDAACKWLKDKSHDPALYNRMPPLKPMPSRADIAIRLGQQIEQLLNRK